MSDHSTEEKEIRIKECFAILRLERTKDSAAIKNAYHELLMSVNPEDDPEGFKRLRAAYEEASAYARTPDDDPEKNSLKRREIDEDSAVGQFMLRFDQIYASISRRIDPKEWEALLADPVVTSLDEGEEVKWRLFGSLSAKYRIPSVIWQMLDHVFLIRENRLEFEEHLPVGFVDHMVKKIEDEDGRSDFWFEALEGPEGADFDGFLQDYYEYVNQVAEHGLDDLKKRREKLDRLDLYEIGHPWLELEKAKLWQMEGEKETALEQFTKLIRRYPEDETIQTHSATGLYRLGQSGEAERIFEKYLKKDNLGRGYRFICLLGMAKIRADQENWKEARRFAVEARGIGSVKELTQLLETVLPKAIEAYEKEADCLTEEEVKELGWSYVQSKRSKDGQAFFDAHPEYCPHAAWWHRISAYLHYQNQEYDEAVREAKNWRGCLEEEKTEDAEKQTVDSYGIEGSACYNLYVLHKEEEEGKDLFEAAESAYDHAIELEPQNISYYMDKVMLYKEAKKYESMAAACEKVKELDQDFYWAYFYLQEAYEGLRMAQAVIDTFYQAKRLYNGNPEIYERAAKVFIAYNQYKDAENILKQADEAGVQSYRLMALSIEAKNGLVKTPEEWQAADDYADKLIRRMKKEKAPKEMIAEALMNRYFLNEDEYLSGKATRDAALKYVLESERLVDDVSKLYYIGRLYHIHKMDDKKAYHYLKTCEDRGMKFEWMYTYLGKIRESAGKYQEAIDYYQKAVESDSKNKKAYWRIGWVYLRKFTASYQPEYGRKALEYFLRQDEEDGIVPWNYWRKAKIHYYMREYETALEEIDKSFEGEGKSGLWFTKADILRAMHRFDEAIECYLRSIHIKQRFNEDNEYCIGKILNCYLRKGEYENCVSCLKKLVRELKKESEHKKCLESLAYAEAQQGHLKEALAWIRKEYGSVDVTKRHCEKLSDEADRIQDIYEIWSLYPSAGEACRCVKKHLDRTAAWIQDEAGQEKEPLKDRMDLLFRLADIYFHIAEFETALVYYEKIYQMTGKMRDYDNAEDLLENMMIAYYYKGDMKKARKYAGIYRRYQDKAFKECTDLEYSIEELIDRQTTGARQSLYKYFLYAFYSGKTELAYAYAEKMKQGCMCYWCSEEECTEMKEVMARLAYYEGDMERARILCEESNRCCYRGNNTLAQQLLIMITHRKNQIVR